MSEVSVTLFGPLDTIVGPYIEFIVLGLVLANFLTRRYAHGQHVQQARDGGAEAIEHSAVHVATSLALVLASLYFMTLHHHGGVVLSVLVVGLFLTDFFEFEARRVEAREDRTIERPKASLVASVFVLLYALYQSVFFLVAPYWNQVV